MHTLSYRPNASHLRVPTLRGPRIRCPSPVDRDRRRVDHSPWALVRSSPFTPLVFSSDNHLHFIAAQRGTGNHSAKPCTAPCPPDQSTPSTFGTTARRRTRHHIRTRAWRLMSSDSLKNMSSKTLRCWGIQCGYFFRCPFFPSH